MARSGAGAASRLVHNGALAFALAGGVAILLGIWSSLNGVEAPAAASVPPATSSLPEPPRVFASAESKWTAELAAPQREVLTRTGTLARRDTLSDLLIRLGASPGEAHAALKPLFDRELLDARRLRPGLKATLSLEPAGATDTLRLVGLSLRSEADHSFFVTRKRDGSFTGTRLNARVTARPQRVAGVVETSLYQTARTGGAGDQQVVDFARIFAYDVDFQREIHPGDRFEIVYESRVDERGNVIGTGDVLYAALDGKVLERAFYRFTPDDDGVTDYFDRAGESATKFLMKTPINGARLSSHFGTRRHPISGYTRMHKGTDFAAPTGTPVYAAGHGIIERASRWGGYGHYVRIRHANGYKTAYAHLSRYGAGIRSGVRVRQGQVIGYVGSTGASTGPHLHYEVMIRDKHVNAMTLNFPTGRKLADTPEAMEAFDRRRREIDAMRHALGAEIEIAGLEGGDG